MGMYRQVCVLFWSICSIVVLLAGFPAYAQKVTATIKVGQTPVAIAINPKTNKIYVVNQLDRTLTIIDGATNTTSTINVGNNPQGVAVNPVTNKIYVASVNDGVLSVIDGATNAVTNVSLTVDGSP